MAVDLLSEVTAAYPIEEFPALWWQHSRWSDERPLAGVRVLDATPVFANTMAKILALISAGAEVTVATNRALPSDPNVLARLGALGIPVTQAPGGGFDVVLDCAGLHAGVPSAFGYVELTRTGVARYASSTRPVFVADSGIIKRIETTLGTGDGFIRAMAQAGHPVTDGATVMVFGLGKVGMGVAYAAHQLGARIIAVDSAASTGGSAISLPAAAALDFLDPTDEAAFRAALADCWCAVAATGVPGGLDRHAEALIESDALLANMGAEDEFGPRVPPARALNAKAPVNFALSEPTLLRYLDATLALSNAGAVELTSGRYPAGLNDPPAALETALVQITREHGLIAEELDALHDLRGVSR